MAVIREQEYVHIPGDLECLTTKFMALEQENQFLLRDLQQVNAKKAQQHDELTHKVHQFEVTHITLRQQGLGSPFFLNVKIHLGINEKMPKGYKESIQ